jgi:hypothetical protein
MSLITKILAGLNILVSFVVIYYAAQVVTVRTEWIKTLDKAQRLRDGDVEILNDALAKEEVLKKVTDKEKQDAIRREFFSAHARRKAAAGVPFDQFKGDKNKVIAESQEAKDIMKDYGAEYYRQIAREQVQDQAPLLRSEEQIVAAEKATLVNIREDYKKQLQLIDDQTAQLKKDKDAEKALTDQMLVENTQRRQELVRLYAELEEGLTARNLAQSREKDLREQLDYMQGKLRRLAAENQKFAEEIQRLEAGK